MPISVGDTFVKIFRDWPDFKKLVDGTEKTLSIQVEAESNRYIIFCLDDSVLYLTRLYFENHHPETWIQAQIDENNTWRTEFEADWLNIANEVISSSLPALSPAQLGAENKFGWSSKKQVGHANIANTNITPLRASTYTPDGVNGQRRVVSTSTSDTSAGSGARQVKITYFDQELAGPKEEIIVLNGTTAVNTLATDIAFVEEFEVVEVGSGGSNVGDIQLHSTPTSGGSIIASIVAADNRMYSSHHYIPPDVKTFISEAAIGSVGTASILGASSSQGRADLVCSNPLDISQPSYIIESYRFGGSGGDSLPHKFTVPIAINGPALITLTVKLDDASGNPVGVYGSFSYYEKAKQEIYMAVQKVAAPTPPNNNLSRALFVWTANNGGVNDILDTDVKMQALLDHCATYGINTLFFSTYVYLGKNNWTGSRVQRMQLFLERCHQSSIQVFALAGDVDWGVNHKWVMENIILYLRRYQDQSKEQQRFDGVLLDVEYWTDEGTYPPATNLPGQLDLVRRFRDHLQIPVGVFAAFYLLGNGVEVSARTDISYRGVSAQDGEHMCDYCDFIVVGTYDDLAAGQDNRFQSWYDYAIGSATNLGKNVGLYSASETADTGGLEGISWWQEGRAAMEAAHTTISNAFYVTGNSVFLGQAIHDYEHHSTMSA